MPADPISVPSEDLAAVLVRITHERGTGVEHLRAEQLLAEARLAWPGELGQRWAEWLSEAARSLGLRPKIADLSIKEALHIAQDGALVIGQPVGNSAPIIVLGFDGRTAEIAAENGADKRSLSPTQLLELLGSENPSQDSPPADATASDRRQWLIVEDLELSHEPSHRFHNRPVRRLLAMLKPERSDIWVLVVFAFFTGVLSLAVPIAVESLVNIVTFGRMLQPLLVLSLLLFGFLAFAALMRALQAFVVEIIQRRLFVRVVADLAYRFPRVSLASLEGEYGPELANRFFDVVTFQKVVAQLLLDGLAIILTTLVGMTVLAFYHPWLLGFDVLLLTMVVGGVTLLGRGGIASGIDESRQKYRLAAWLEDLLRCPIGFKTAGAADFALDRANHFAAKYLAFRQQHFAVLFRQLVFLLALQAVAATVLLGFGGWLVVKGQLSLGQLVAAELIVATILSSMAKLGKHIEGFYDVVAAVDKLGHLFDLSMETQDGSLALRSGSGAQLRVTDVSHASGGDWVQRGVSLSIEAGEKVALLDPHCAGASTLLDILYGLRIPEGGHVEIENADPRDLRPDVLRRAVVLVRGIEVFQGSIAENVQLGRPDVSITDVRETLGDVGLLDDILRLPDGLDYRLNATGRPLTDAQLCRLMLARAIVGRPRLLLVDGILDALGDAELDRLGETIAGESRPWTLVLATSRAAVAKLCDRIIETTPSPVESPPSGSNIKEPMHDASKPKPPPEESP